MRLPLAFFCVLWLLTGVLLGPAAQAQQAGDTTSVACGRPQPLMLCVDLDGRPSVDPGAGPLTYRWQMGDGTTLTGPLVTHCYKERRVYSVQLDVLVNNTGELRRAEKRLTVDLVRQDIVDFTVSASTVRVGEAVTFSAPDAQLPDCQNVVLLWDFRDGLVGQGREVRHSFRKPGRYAVRFSLRANGPGTCPDSHCVSREIVVEP